MTSAMVETPRRNAGSSPSPPVGGGEGRDEGGTRRPIRFSPTTGVIHPKMKTLILCLDGTWNGPDRDDLPAAPAPPSNVFRVFASLEGDDDPLALLLRDEQTRRADGQVAKYLRHTGDPANPLVAMLGGGKEAHALARILRGYAWLSRNHAPGDAIHLVGFSRGAYTARTLAALIAARGLLDAQTLDLSDRPRTWRLAAATWHDWKREAAATAYLKAGLAALTADLPGFVAAPPPEARHEHVPIQTVAVWETVGLLGIPDYWGMASRDDAFRFADIVLPPNVQHGFHVLAIDERRADFAPTWWQPDPRIIQCLVPGAHEDAGGGQPLTNNESGLADASFAWMKDHLAATGLRFRPAPPFEIAPDPYGTAHQPWTEFPFSSRAQGPRELLPGLTVSQIARDRLAGGPVLPAPHLPPRRYNPINLAGYV